MQALVRFLSSFGLVALVVASPVSAAADGPCGPPRSTLGNRLIASVMPLLEGSHASFPLDSIPTSDDTTVYFTARGQGVFRVSAEGGAAAALATDHAFVDPVGIELSRDQQTVYVADPQARAPRGVG